MGVLFADITDSTRLYQKLGDAGARALVNARLSTLTYVLPRYNGRLVKTIGDEVMCVFPDADAAVRAASDMQSRIASAQNSEQPVRIHIGVHYGPVLVEGSDVFGDTVNVAAYLTAVATADQILTTEETNRNLSAEVRTFVRPVFQAVLKGSSEESTVHEVLWRADTADLTNVNSYFHKIIPGDTGSLLLELGDNTVRVSQACATISIGRAESSDLRTTDMFASRHHATVRLIRQHFYLFDHSINGSFVLRESGEEVRVPRAELLLEGMGKIALGRSHAEQPDEVIEFRRDRRSIYRT